MRGNDVRRGGTFEGRIGDAAGVPPPADAERASFLARDPDGLSCRSAAWILRALTRLDASVWVEHAEAGHLQLTDGGRWTQGGRELWVRFYRGEVITVAATGPQSDEALAACVEMAALDPPERKRHYRVRYSSGRPAGARRKACPVCEHPERGAIDEELSSGASPRSVRSHFPGLTRADLTAHRDGCA